MTYLIEVYLSKTSSLDQIVELAKSGVAGQRLDILEQVLLFRLKQLAIVWNQQRMRPKGAYVDTDHLRCVDDLPQRPHEGAIDAHQLLRLDLVGLVEHHTDLVLMVLKGLDDLRELVRDVQLVGVEQEDDAVHALGEPLQHRSEVIA